MSGNVAGDRIRSFVERIERLKSEQDDLTADIKNVYAEAKGEGFDKAALGEVVAIRRKQAKNPGAFDEKLTLVGLYMNALEEAGLTHTPAPARPREAAGEGSQHPASDDREPDHAHDPEAHSSHTEGSGDGGHVRSFEGGV